MRARTTKSRAEVQRRPRRWPAADVVVVSDVTWFNFALSKRLAPIDDLARTIDVDTERLRRRAPGDYKFENGHCALPYSRSTPLFYYNKDLWSKAGLEDRDPKDWTEMKDWMGQAQGRRPGRRRRLVRPTAPATSPGSSRTCCRSSVASRTGSRPSPTPRPSRCHLLPGPRQWGYKFGKGPDADFGASLTACAIMSHQVARWRDERRSSPSAPPSCQQDSCPDRWCPVGIPMAWMTHAR